ncbi:hypothetical protein AB0425_14470, partial [Actinosynnema sp. NPDC051121]
APRWHRAALAPRRAGTAPRWHRLTWTPAALERRCSRTPLQPNALHADTAAPDAGPDPQSR